MLLATTLSLVWLTFRPERPAKRVFERAMSLPLFQWCTCRRRLIGRRGGDRHHVAHGQGFAAVELEEDLVVFHAHGIHQADDGVVVVIGAWHKFYDQVSGRAGLILERQTVEG